MNTNILQYESDIWQTANLLIASGIKQSDFPSYMMPFLALILIESRLVRMLNNTRTEFEEEEHKDLSLKDFLEILDEEDKKEFIEEVKQEKKGYNSVLVEQGYTLKDIVKNDKTLRLDFDAYLKAFDNETQMLLGVGRANAEEKYLDIEGVSGRLNKKGILIATLSIWSEIDLVPYDNSEIVLLEEHIKRKWADISAATAGEQYTPSDIIELMGRIVYSKIKPNPNSFITIYDPACGGGNLLFGIEDMILQKLDKQPTMTFGQDWNSTLYALAKIESRFRKEAKIEYGNTLTSTTFLEKTFNIVVANPPHGISWKGFKSDITKDKTGRFRDFPATGDGQLLFAQHIISQMASDGIAVVVHNGSALFSGDAGSGESNIRKYFLENDYIEAIIQNPTDEFFNTNIHTYLWILNKNKAKERKGKIILIDASEHYVPLAKSKGKKRKEISKEQQKLIVETLNNFEDTDFAKILDIDEFFYNKQAIRLTNVDEKGNTIEDLLPIKIDKKSGEEKQATSIKLKPIRITQTEADGSIIDIDTFTITDKKDYATLKMYQELSLKPFIAQLDYKETDLKVNTKEAVYFYDKTKNTIIKETKNETEIIREELGCGKIVIKTAYKKATKTLPASIGITVELMPDYQKDYEIIPYSKNLMQNQQNIEAFMAKYVTKPFRYEENKIGVEINFNKLFYKPEQLRTLDIIVTELNELQQQLQQLENELAL